MRRSDTAMGGFFSNKDYSFEELVYRGVESDELDYKTHMSWNSMSRSAKGKLVRHLIAFANTRGGFLVIGVGEDKFGNPNCCTGVSLEEAGSFDPSAVGTFINSYVEPAIDFTIERPVVRGKKYVIFVIRPFKTLPHVCSNSIEGELQSGVFYIRTVEASSRPARRALEMQELIRRALRNEREQLGNVIRSILNETPAAASAVSPVNSLSCLDAVEESEHYFRRRTDSFALPQIKLTISPENYIPGTYQLDKLRSAFKRALRPDILFLHESESTALPTPGSLRYISTDSRRMWQLFDSGLFCFFTVISKPELDFSGIVRLCAVASDFIGNLYSALNWEEERLTVRLEIVNPAKVHLCSNGEKYSFSLTPPCAAEFSRSAAELAKNKPANAVRLAAGMGELFALPESELQKLPADVKGFLENL